MKKDKIEFLKCAENRILIVMLATLLCYWLCSLFISNGFILMVCYVLIYVGLSKVYDNLLKRYCRKIEGMKDGKQ